MFGQTRSSLQRTLLALLCSALLALALAQVALAQQEPASAQPGATADDGGAWEVGIHGTAGDLTAATAAELLRRKRKQQDEGVK